MQSLSAEDRLALTHAILALLDEWGVTPAAQVALLGLPEGMPARKLRRFYEDTPLPEDPSVDEHLDHLMGIADALRTTYPRNENMGARWMRSPCREFGGRTPIAVMVEGGTAGLIAVRSHLDCSYAWDRSGSSHRSATS